MSYRTSALRPTRVRVAARTDVGPHRSRNEDAFLVADLSTGARFHADAYAGVLESDAGVALAVIDGMCGGGMGDRPTRIAQDVFHAALREGAPAGDEAARTCLLAAMNAASAEIFAGGRDDLRLKGMGAVVVLALVAGDRLHVASAGDSRAYILRAGRLVPITRDDVLINDALEMMPNITDEELASLPRNVVTKALGVMESVAARAETFPLCAGDVLFVCSDGMYFDVPDAVMERALLDLPDPAEACAALLELAIKAGTRDNVTVLVARPEGDFLRAPGAEDAIASRNVPLTRASRGTG